MVNAPLTYVAVFFVLQWIWDFIIIGKLHGYVEHLFDLTGEGTEYYRYFAVGLPDTSLVWTRPWTYHNFIRPNICIFGFLTMI